MDLFERDDQLATVAAQWRAARSGSGSLVLVSGESGIGKTTLVRAVADDLSSEAPVHWGSCDPLSTPRPIGPLHDIAEDFGAAFCELLRSGALAHEIFERVLEELRSTSRLLIIDDLHWADEGTIDLLRFLLRRIATTRSLVMGTYRADEIGTDHPLRTLLGDAARTPDAQCLSLGPLSVETLAEMIGDRLIDARWLHGLTAGNPFFVGEVLARDGEELPGSVRDAVLARTVGLDREARDLLDVLACAPEAIPDRLLPALGVGIPPLRELDEAGLIQHGRRGLAFRHEMCRLVIAGAIPPGGEVALHLRILDAMESTDTADPSAMVHHAVASGDAARVLRYASLAGVEAARTGAHTQAAAFFQTALTQGHVRTERERAELLEMLATELYLIGRLQEAISASEQAMAIRQTEGNLSGVSVNHQSLSMYEWYNAHRGVAERHASTAVEVLEPAGDLVALGHAYATEAYLALQNSDLARVRLFEARARAIAADVDDRRLDNRLEIIAAATAIQEGDLEGRRRILDVIERRTDHFDEVYSSGYSNLVYLDVEQRRLDEAREVLKVSLPLTVERDIPICHGWQLGMRARLGLMQGDWDAALVDASEVLEGPAAPLAQTWPFLVRALVSLRRGDDGSDHDLDEAWELATALGEPLRLLPAMAALAERSWLLGTHEARLDDAPAQLGRWATTDGMEWAVGDLVVWLHRMGRGDEVTAIPVVTEPHRLLLSGDARTAADRWEELSAPYEQALALLDVGAEDAAATAIGLLDDLGAEAVAAKARLTLRARGLNVPGRRRAATRANAFGLTARQMDVLRLLEDGLTNAELADRLYISPKTADHHVSAILSKLQVRNRREAVQKARTLGLVS